MNVGVFLSDVGPRVGGGYTYQKDILLSLASLSKESRHHFTVFFHNSKYSGEIQDILKSHGIRSIAFDALPSSLLSTRINFRVQRFISSIRRIMGESVRRQPTYFDRIFHALGIEFVWFLANRHVQVDTPYMTTVWDLQHRVQPWFPEVSAFGEWDRREAEFGVLLRRATAIIAGTETGRREIERYFQIPAGRIRVLPLPTPSYVLDAPAGDGAEVLARLGIPEGYLFYPAQFWSHKNHANLLLAAAKLRDEYDINLPVVFVGSNRGNQIYIRQLTEKLGLSGQVYFLGFVSSEDLIELYRNAAALVFLTFFGPDNLPPLEAFALGCPVVASNVPGAEEQFGDAAVLVDPKSPRKIAEAIRTLLEDQKLRETMTQRGRERAKKWSGQDFVRGVFTILDDFESVRRCWSR